jgi:glycerol-3-phosphate acyltransferase PlsY
VPTWLAVPAGGLVGAVPFTNLAARWTRGVDLRDVGGGTVSGTGLYQVAGFAPLAAAGVLDVAKGTVGPLLVGRSQAGAGLAGIVAVAGHNWSPLLQGAGGRGLAPAIGVFAVVAPAGSALLLIGLAGGRLAGQTALGSLAAMLAAVPVIRWVHGPAAARTAEGIVAVLLAKRLMGNRRAEQPSAPVYLWRLLFDRDTRLAEPDGEQPDEPAGRGTDRDGAPR